MEQATIANDTTAEATSRNRILGVINSLNFWMEAHRPDIDPGYEDFFTNFELFMLAKNLRYGNSAIEPLYIFTHDTQEPNRNTNVKLGIMARIDDKLSRIRMSSSLRKNDVIDLLGYLVLLMVAREWYEVDPRGVRECQGSLDVFGHGQKARLTDMLATISVMDSILAEIQEYGSIRPLVSELMVALVRTCVRLEWTDFSELVD